MKSKLRITLVAVGCMSGLGLSACDDATKTKTIPVWLAQYNNAGDCVTVKLDGCEYFIVKNNSGGILTMTHKGNCQNPIHENRQP